MGERLGDAHHEAAVEDGPERGGGGRHDLGLDVAKRHEPQVDLPQPRGEVLGKAGRLAGAGGVGEGLAVEMHRRDGGSPLGQLPDGDGGVDAARQEGDDTPRGPRRQATRAGQPVGVEEGPVLDQLDVAGPLAVRQVDPGAGGVLDGLADDLVHPLRAFRERGMAPAGPHAEGFEGRLPGERQRRGDDQVHVRRRRDGGGEAGEPEGPPEGLGDPAEVGVLGQLDEDASGN